MLSWTSIENLKATEALRFNIEGEVKRLMKVYSEAEICEKVKEDPFKSKDIFYETQRIEQTPNLVKGTKAINASFQGGILGN